jgi:hypothetical protein
LSPEGRRAGGALAPEQQVLRRYYRDTFGCTRRISRLPLGGARVSPEMAEAENAVTAAHTHLKPMTHSMQELHDKVSVAGRGGVFGLGNGSGRRSEKSDREQRKPPLHRRTSFDGSDSDEGEAPRFRLPERWAGLIADVVAKRAGLSLSSIQVSHFAVKAAYKLKNFIRL